MAVSAPPIIYYSSVSGKFGEFEKNVEVYSMLLGLQIALLFASISSQFDVFDQIYSTRGISKTLEPIKANSYDGNIYSESE